MQDIRKFLPDPYEISLTHPLLNHIKMSHLLVIRVCLEMVLISVKVKVKVIEVRVMTQDDHHTIPREGRCHHYHSRTIDIIQTLECRHTTIPNKVLYFHTQTEDTWIQIPTYETMSLAEIHLK